MVIFESKIEAKQMKKAMQWFVLKKLEVDQISTKIKNNKFNTGKLK